VAGRRGREGGVVERAGNVGQSESAAKEAVVGGCREAQGAGGAAAGSRPSRRRRLSARPPGCGRRAARPRSWPHRRRGRGRRAPRARGRRRGRPRANGRRGGWRGGARWGAWRCAQSNAGGSRPRATDRPPSRSGRGLSRGPPPRTVAPHRVGALVSAATAVAAEDRPRSTARPASGAVPAPATTFAPAGESREACTRAGHRRPRSIAGPPPPVPLAPRRPSVAAPATNNTVPLARTRTLHP